MLEDFVLSNWFILIFEVLKKLKCAWDPPVTVSLILLVCGQAEEKIFPESKSKLFYTEYYFQTTRGKTKT